MMKYLIICSMLFLAIIKNAGAQEIASVETVQIHSKALGQDREILVYTPQLYDESRYAYYDVIYVFDAQNREFFDYTHSLISFLSNGEKKFIVVGITSPYNEALDYARNNDLLPYPKNTAPDDFYGGYSGNADNFLKYIKTEVVPYIDNHYRTLGHRIAVGHSLSASFIIYSLMNETALFDDYIAVSPNFAYDKQRLVDDLYHFDFNTIDKPYFLYISNADEANYWTSWKPAREKVYSFLRDSVAQPNLKVVIDSFPGESHWNSFAPALRNALTVYFEGVYQEQQNELSDSAYNIRIILKVPDKKDTVYITGNQSALANWDPSKLKMNRLSDLEREIRLNIHSPAMFKFTRGSWKTEAEVEGNPQMVNMVIKPENGKTYRFVITNWADRWE